MTSKVPTAAAGRVVERRRAVALARHFRDAEGLSIAQIADRLGRSPATIKAYFYDHLRLTKDLLIQVLMTDRVSERRRAARATRASLPRPGGPNDRRDRSPVGAR